jgi:hypothetical protein
MSEEKGLVKPEWFKSQGSMSEIYQQTGMMFAFVGPPKDGLKVCHPWVKCRDFLHDAVRSQITGKPCAIYGFNFKPASNPPIDLKRMRMLVTKGSFRSEDEMTIFKAKIAAALVLINHFERQAKSSLSMVQEVDATGSGKRLVFMFTGPGMWVKSPFLISMYTFLIRLGDKELKFKNAKDLKSQFKGLHKVVERDNDVAYLDRTWDKLHPIIKNRKILFNMKDGVHDIFFKDISINQFHDYGGIVSLAKGQARDPEINEKLEEILAEVKK